VASGGLSLPENYLYTTEAFRAYYDHLTDNGTLVILRWDMDIPRLISNSLALLGPRDASSRVAVLMEKRSSKIDPSQMLFMLHKRPFTSEETQTMVEQWTMATPVIVPGRQSARPYGDLLSGRTSLAEYEAQSARFVGPVFDDSPFYFAVERPWGMASNIASRLIYRLLLPGFALFALFAAAGKPRGAAVTPYATSVVYFSCLGFGFIAIELSLLQNMTLLLGHPIFTLSVLLFTLLAAGGVGSAVSRVVPIPAACLAVALIGSVEALALPRVVPLLLPLTLWARVAIAILLIGPLGLVMGMPFPLGLQRTGRGALPAPPFYWGLNGIMSVIGSVCTVFVALRLGFQAAMLIGAACYILAGLASLKALTQAAPIEG
jgi:hypothetical protein